MATTSAAVPGVGTTAGTVSCADATTATLYVDSGYVSVLGRVALAGGAGAYALQTATSRVPDPSKRFWSKTGLLVRGDDEIVLEAPEAEEFWFGWGSPADPAKRLTIRECGGDSNVWTVFVGGFWTDRPKCVHLTVRASGAETSLPVGLGAPCPGQLPPLGPTER